MPRLVVLDSLDGSGYLRADDELTEHVPAPGAALQPEFVVDPASGQDDAPGTYAAPLRSLRAVVRRLGRRYAPRIDQTITLLGDVAEPVSWWVDCSHARLVIRGLIGPAQFSGTISDATARAPAANQLSEVQSSWVLSQHTAHVVKHGPTGRTCWVAKDLGSGRARTSPWWRAATDVGHVSPGDVVSTHKLTRIGGLSMYAHGGWLEGGTTGLVFQDLDFSGPVMPGRRSTFTASGNVIWEGCRFSHLPQLNGGQLQLRGCCVDGDVADINYFLGNVSPVNVVFAACLSRLRLELGTSVGGSVVALSFGTLIQGATGNGFDVHSGGVLRVVDMAVADATGNGVEAKYGGHIVAGGPLVGTGNGGYGYRGYAATRAVWMDTALSTAKITGAQGDYLLVDSTGTWAALAAGAGRVVDAGAFLGKN